MTKAKQEYTLLMINYKELSKEDKKKKTTTSLSLAVESKNNGSIENGIIL